MANLIGFIKRDIVNPVAHVLNPISDVQAGINAVANHTHIPVVTPLAKQAQGIANFPGQVTSALPNAARFVTADLTHNNIARQNALNALTQSQHAVGGTLQGFPRSIIQSGLSLSPGGVRRPVVPTNPLSRFALGNQPVNSLQQDYSNQRNSGVSRANALTNTGVSGIMDAATLYGGIKGGKALAKGQLKTAGISKPSKLNPTEVAQLSRYHQQMGNGNIIPEHIYRPGVQAAVKAKVNPSDQHAIGNLIGAHRNYDVQLANRQAQLTNINQKLGVKNLGLSTEKVSTKPPAFTGVPKTPGAFKRAYQSVNSIIAQHGTGGQEIARRLGEHRNQSEVGQEAFLEKIPSVGSLKKNDFTTFVQALDKRSRGESPNVAPYIQKAIDEWNKAIPSIRDRAVKAGLQVGDLGPNYFPRHYKDLFTNDKSMGKMAKQMVDSGKATDLGDAIGKLQFMKNEYQRPFGNLEKTRQFDLPGYETSHEALTNYVSRSFDRITKAEQFGAKNENLKQLLGKVQSEGYSATPGSVLDRNLKIALGDTDKSTAAHRFSSGVRKFNALRSLSAAGISNATQLTNTATVAGFGRTVKGIARLSTSPAARAEARQTGVLLDHSVNELAKQGLGTGGKITANIASPFFRTVERFNRQATAIVGKDYGNKLAKQGDVAQLRDKFGVTGDIGKALTRDQEIQVSRKLVELSQFKVDPMDLPGWVDSPMGKLVAQFRTFGYKQTGFIWNQVLREATKGNFLPLARFTAIAIPAGAGSQYLKSKIKGTQYTSPGEGKGTEVAKALAAVGAFGLPGSEGQNLYKSSQYGNTIGGVAGTFGGPTGSLIAQTSVNADKAHSGDKTPLIKQGLSSIPTVGPSIANRVLPKAAAKAVANNSGSAGTPEQRKANASAEIKALGKNAGNGYSLQQTSDGKYAYTLDGDPTVHTASDLKSARTAVAEAGFKKEGTSYKVIGDTVYRKAADGSVTKTTKTKFDYQIGTATLTAQKNAGDVEGWLKTANSQLDSIAKQLKEPNIDPLDALTLQNEADALQKNIAKYTGYGGFTKGKKPSSTKFSTASKIKAPKLPSIKVPKTTAYKASSQKKLAVSKIPVHFKGKSVA